MVFWIISILRSFCTRHVWGFIDSTQKHGFRDFFQQKALQAQKLVDTFMENKLSKRKVHHQMSAWVRVRACVMCAAKLPTSIVSECQCQRVSHRKSRQRNQILFPFWTISVTYWYSDWVSFHFRKAKFFVLTGRTLLFLNLEFFSLSF